MNTGPCAYTVEIFPDNEKSEGRNGNPEYYQLLSLKGFYPWNVKNPRAEALKFAKGLQAMRYRVFIVRHANNGAKWKMEEVA